MKSQQKIFVSLKIKITKLINLKKKSDNFSKIIKKNLIKLRISTLSKKLKISSNKIKQQKNL